jgi:hypothetical protein
MFIAPACAEPPTSALANVVAGEITLPVRPPQVIERVDFFQDGQQQTVAGRVLIEARDGGVLVEAADGAQWTIEGPAVLSRKRTASPFKALTSDEMAKKLLVEFPDGFRVHTTTHYVVCYNTSREYAEWTSSLYERLYKAFTKYWERKGIELREPEFPLVVVAFADRASYAAAAASDLGGAARTIVGFYSLRSNRVNMYDLTGAESLRAQSTGRQNGANRRGSTREINQMLSQPAAVPLVSTIVHEATHQIAFNCGLQTRFADIPLWQCEGMAVYFEAPDLASSRGWRGIGRVNYPRLASFRRNLPNWRNDSLETLVTDSRRFRDPRTAVAAYADAWALNYYLIKYRPDEYTAYLKMLAEKRPLIEDDPATRLAEFRQHFGDLRSLERDLLRQMSRVQ